MASVFNQVKLELSRAGLVQQYQYELRATVRIAINAFNYENAINNDARTQSPRLTAARLQLAVGRCGLGPRGQGDQRTQRASLVATYHARVQLGSDALLLKKITCEAPRHVSSRPDWSLSVGLDARVHGRATCTRRGARRSSSRRWLEISESINLTAESHERKNE